MRQWFLSMFKKLKNPSRGCSPVSSRQQARLSVEALEVRQVMTAALGAAAALHQVVPPPSAPTQARTVQAAPTTNGQLQFNASTAPTSQQTPAATGAQAVANPLQNQGQPGAAPVQDKLAASPATPAHQIAPADGSAVGEAPDPASVQHATLGGKTFSFGMGADGKVVESTDGKTWNIVGQSPAMSSLSVTGDGSSISVLGVGKDGHLYQNGVQSLADGSVDDTGPWTDLQVPGTGVSKAQTVYNPDGSFEVLALNSTGDLYSYRRVVNEANLGPDGKVMSGLSEFQGIQRDDGRVAVFGVSKNGVVQESIQNGVDSPGFSHIDAITLGSAAIDHLQVAKDSAGRIELFGISTKDNNGVPFPTVMQTTESAAKDGVFPVWSDLHHAANSIAVGKNAAGELQLFASGFGGQINTLAETGPGAWPADGWTRMKDLPNSPARIDSLSTRQDNGQLVLRVSGATQTGPGTFETRQSADGTFSDWQSVGAATPMTALQNQTALSPQQQSDALKVQPLSSPQMAQDLQRAAVAHAPVALPEMTGALKAQDSSPGGGLDLSLPNLADAIQHTLEKVNDYRASVGAPPVRLDLGLGIFATLGSMELRSDHVPHKHVEDIVKQTPDQPGQLLFTQYDFRDHWAENQSNELGQPPAPGGVNEQIDQVLASMFAEGPPPPALPGQPPNFNHYSNMTDPTTTRMGVGLVADASGNLYLTTDFSA